MTDGGGPDWVREGMRQLSDEVRLFLRTAVDFTVHPARFGKEWVSGQRHALNPLGFLATAFAVIAPFEAVLAHLIRADDQAPASLVSTALAALLPFAYYLLLGILQHGVLRLFGSRRPLRDSCAMALYAGGGPATAARIVVGLLVLGLFYRTGATGISDLHQRGAALVIIGTFGSFTLFLGTLGAALGGVHAKYGVRGWHIFVANAVAIAVSGFMFGVLRPPGSYGLHLVLFWHHDTSWHFSFSLGD